MRRILTVLLVFVAMGLTFAQTTSSVTFTVNMGVAAQKGKLNVAADKVYLSGSMNGWNGTNIPMTRTSSTTDTVYTVTLTDMIVDSVYHYKFVAGSNWELLNGDDNIHRTYKVKANAADNVLPVVYWSDDNVYANNPAKPILVHFKCNMEFEIAKGFFDPSVDVLNVRGGHNGWSGTANIMKKPLLGYVYTCDTTVNMAPGDSLGHKFAYTHAGNVTWETPSPDPKFGVTKADYDAGTITVSRYFDFGDQNNSKTGFDLVLQVNVKGAKSSFQSGVADFPHGIKNVIACGSQRPLVWPPLGWPDSTFKDLIQLNDNGENGDLVKGDSIWSAKITFPKYANLKFEYKYGINYGLPADNGGGNDNEAYMGGNHKINITNSSATQIWVNDVFGKTGDVQYTTSVNDKSPVVAKYSLEQNYPNPFNPSTTIKYSVPEAGMVTLKVFNMLGQEVATLVNEVKSASENTVSFNASNLASGLYIYQINAKNFTASKKMMLLK